MTQINCSASELSVRRILSDFVPLSQYERILWVSETKRKDGELETRVQYLGPAGREVWLPDVAREPLEAEAVDYRTGVHKLNGVIPFDAGEIAFRNNPDPD